MASEDIHPLLQQPTQRDAWNIDIDGIASRSINRLPGAIPPPHELASGWVEEVACRAVVETKHEAIPR